MRFFLNDSGFTGTVVAYTADFSTSRKPWRKHHQIILTDQKRRMHLVTNKSYSGLTVMYRAFLDIL